MPTSRDDVCETCDGQEWVEITADDVGEPVPCPECSADVSREQELVKAIRRAKALLETSKVWDFSSVLKAIHCLGSVLTEEEMLGFEPPKKGTDHAHE
jgi:hypothetical protein